MLETVAVLSDIHGVLPALDAVLAESAVREADLLVVTGDIAAGPQPIAVLDRLLGIGERAVLVRATPNAREDIRTVVCGHTHMPFVRLVDTRLVVNPGSVGMPYGGAGAHWALLERGAVTLRTSHFDIEAARREIAVGSDYPDVEEWTDYYLNSRASDFEALRVFGPRDGR